MSCTRYECSGGRFAPREGTGVGMIARFAAGCPCPHFVPTFPQEQNNRIGRCGSPHVPVHIACKTVVVQSSFPALEIINTAKRFECDAIVMATRSQMGVLDPALNESQTHVAKSPVTDDHLQFCLAPDFFRFP